MIDRSARREVRNPVLALPATGKLMALEPDIRHMIRDLVVDLRDQARAKADESLRKNKYMMFAYWKCVAVYANHFARCLN